MNMNIQKQAHITIYIYLGRYPIPPSHNANQERHDKSADRVKLECTEMKKV